MRGPRSRVTILSHTICLVCILLSSQSFLSCHVMSHVPCHVMSLVISCHNLKSCLMSCHVSCDGTSHVMSHVTSYVSCVIFHVISCLMSCHIFDKTWPSCKLINAQSAIEPSKFLCVFVRVLKVYANCRIE